MGKYTRSQQGRINTLMMYIVLFVICVFIVQGFKSGIRHYYKATTSSIKNAQWHMVLNAIETSTRVSTRELEETTEEITAKINSTVDIARLRAYLEKGTPYPEFETLMRESLHANIFTDEYVGLDPNRNSIFVMVNGRMIASYSHDKELLAVLPMNETAITPFTDILSQISYNPQLAINAIGMIERQSDGIIIWQKDEPTTDELKQIKYSYVSNTTLKTLFMKHGLPGLESYEILVPVYITKYGNIFGESDWEQTDVHTNNKIIIVQRINIKDYLDKFYTKYIEDADVNNLDAIYTTISGYFNLLECILYLSIIVFILQASSGINKIVDEAHRSSI